MPAKKQKKDYPAYQIKVTLKGIRPPIWRKFLVTGDVSLRELHNCLQVIMGWEGGHLHQFIIDGKYYGEPDPESFDDIINENKIQLGEVARKEKRRFIYEYDFGDSWEHELLIEKLLPPEPGKRYPVVLKGKRACPPEDCGGVWGYANMLEIIKNPNHEEYESTMEWIGCNFDPEDFEVEFVNACLEAEKKRAGF